MNRLADSSTTLSSLDSPSDDLLQLRSLKPENTSWNSGLLRSIRTVLPAATSPSRTDRWRQQLIDVGLLCRCRSGPRESPSNSRAIGLLKCPKLALGNDGDGGQHDGAIAAALKAQCLTCVALSERDLPALADDLDFRPFDERRTLCHAIIIVVRYGWLQVLG